MTLDDNLSNLIKKNNRFVKKEFDDFLSSQSFELRNKNPDLIKNYSINFLSTYYAVKETIKQKTTHLDDAITRMYCSAISTEIILNSLNEENENQAHTEIQGLNFNESDYDSNLRILKNYTLIIKNYNQNPKVLTKSYFKNLQTELKKTLLSSLSEIDLKSLNSLSTNKSFSVLEKKVTKIRHSNEECIENISFVNTEYEDIIGNKEVKDELLLSMRKLFLFDEEKNMNPALEMNQFKQHYLLEGEPGNGKGMLGAYAATIGTNLSKKLGKKLRIISLENNSDYQDGPILKLLTYLNEISTSKDLYLILLDEIDSAFTSRTDDRTQNYQRKLTNELLKFTSNSIAYVNRGNYVIISMTNTPDQLDKAFISRTNNSRYVCEGPKESTEKSLLIKNLLHKLVPKNKIQIEDWETIGQTAYKLNLSGRDLAGCVRNLFEKHSEREVPDSLFKKTYEDRITYFSNFKKITQKSLLEEVLKMKNKEKTNNYLQGDSNEKT